MTRPTISDLSPRFQAQAVAQLHGTPKPRTVKIEPAEPLPATKRLRQNASGLNKTEAAFFVHLSNTFLAGRVLTQCVTLKLANGVRYTPDFTVTRDATNGHSEPVTAVSAYEVKGFMRDDAAVKLKVAASLYPWIKFHLVSKRKGGGWDVQEVLS